MIFAQRKLFVCAAWRKGKTGRSTCRQKGLQHSAAPRHTKGAARFARHAMCVPWHKGTLDLFVRRWTFELSLCVKRHSPVVGPLLVNICMKTPRRRFTQKYSQPQIYQTILPAPDESGASEASGGRSSFGNTRQAENQQKTQTSVFRAEPETDLTRLVLSKPVLWGGSRRPGRPFRPIF